MENDILNPTTKQLLIQPISDAALLTDPGFVSTTCNSAALAWFLYNQQDIPGHSISFLASPLLNFRETDRTYTSRRANAKTVFSKLQAQPIPLINQIPINNLNHESTGCR